MTANDPNSPSENAPVPISDNQLDRQARADLISLIEFELATRGAKQKSMGWTPWALWGAVAVLCWLLLDHFPRENLCRVAVLVVALELLYWTPRWIVDMLTPKPRQVGMWPMFKLASNDLGSRKYYLVLCAANNAVLCGISAVCVRAVSEFWWAYTLIFGSIAISCGALFAWTCRGDLGATFVRAEPTIKFDKGWLGVLQVACLAALMALPAVASAVLFAALGISLTADLIFLKASLLMFGITRLLYQLAAQNHTDPVDKELVELRRQMTRGRLTVQEAEDEFDSIIGRLPTYRILQDQVRGLQNHAGLVVAKMMHMGQRLSGLLDANQTARELPPATVDAVLLSHSHDLEWLFGQRRQLERVHRHASGSAIAIQKLGGDPKEVEALLAHIREIHLLVSTEWQKLSELHALVLAEYNIKPSPGSAA